MTSLKAQLTEKTSEFEKGQSEMSEKLLKEEKLRADLQQELEELQRQQRAARTRAMSYPNLEEPPMQDQVRHCTFSHIFVLK